ncbi:MAG: YggS family pyridoxal phosphate-dependent enzyme [Candidatus Margulisbacteria bacterium]|nr:YggS family pyridoxal phosphate-dependent enzyme [Candidatus Margulisiibacteriota bacterium]
MSNLKQNLKSIQTRVAIAAEKQGKTLADIKIIVVTKTIPAQLVEEVIQAGVVDIGENRVQEADEKIGPLKKKYPAVKWHMVGHLQRNKVRQALPLFDIIQSLDSERLAQEIQKKAEAQKIPVLIEVNTSAETTKNGVPVAGVVEFAKKVSVFGNLRVEGLMTIGPLGPDPEQARPCFKKLKELSLEIKNLDLPNFEMKYLSMGMSDDFEVAIQEGSNMIRVGRAVFPACRQAGDKGVEIKW